MNYKTQIQMNHNILYFSLILNYHYLFLHLLDNYVIQKLDHREKQRKQNHNSRSD